MKEEEQVLLRLRTGAPTFLTAISGGSADVADCGKPRRSSAALCKVAELASASSISAEYLKQIAPVALEWRSLVYTVPLGLRRRQTKTILAEVSGSVQPGQLLAVMGPTGSGKSSLIHALCGRLPKGGTLAGEVLVNGHPRGEGFQRITAVVAQEDALFANLTVRESLEFAANIRLPGSVSQKDKRQLVDSVLSEMGLAKAAGTLIGSTFVRGVSGGERKRCYIAVELLYSPSLIFLDEPTSGLDAFQAQSVMETLWALAGEGRTVVCTIHQPRSSIYRMFDQLLLLSEGRTIFFGGAAAAAQHFSEAGFNCPAGFNPADFLLDLTSTDHRSKGAEEASRERVQLLAELHSLRQRRQHRRLQGADDSASDGDVPVLARDAAAGPSASSSGAGRSFANNPFREFQLLLGRAVCQSRRNWVVHVISAAQTVFTAGIFAWLWSGMSQSAPGGIQDNIGLLFLCAVTIAMTSMMGALVTFSFEAGIVARERASKAYRMLPYFLARSTANLPFDAALGVLFSSILYWAVGLRPTAGAFFTFCALIVCEGLAGHSLGVAISAAIPNAAIGMAVAPMVVISLMLFSGFYVNDATLPAVLRWIKYLSHLYYAFSGLAVNEFQGRTGWACPQDQAIPGCQVSGDQVLEQLNFGSVSVGEAFMGLLLLTLVFNILGYLVLRFLKKPRYLPITPTAKQEAAEQPAVEVVAAV